MKFPFNFWSLPTGTVIAKRTIATDPHAAIKVATISTVDWGDGTPIETAPANTQLNHVYGTLGEVTVVITAVAPLAMNPNLSVKHPSATAVDAGWTEIIIRDPHMVDFTVKPNSLLKTIRVLGPSRWKPYLPTNVNHMPSLEEIELDAFESNNLQSIADGNTNLKKFVCLTASGYIDINYAFRGCTSLELIQWDISQSRSPQWLFMNAAIPEVIYDFPQAMGLDQFLDGANVPKATITGTRKVTRANKFAFNSTLVTINRMDLEAIVFFAAGFQNCKLLVHHPGYIGELNQDISYMFYGCSMLETIGDIGMANVTNTTSIFWSCNKLRSLTLRGLKVSIGINGMSLNATALDAVFTSLGTANAGATINISGNPGAATCNKTIATAKSWSVTG